MNETIFFTASFLLISIPVSAVDIYKKEIPDLMVFAGISVLLCERIFIFGTGISAALGDMLPGGLTLLGVRLMTKGKLGMGDVKYGFFLSLYTGIPLWFFSLLFASLLGILFFLTGMAAENLKRDSKIPFAPFLTAGCIGAYYFRNEILSYLWSCNW